MTAWAINGFGLVLIGLIFWWFWLYRPKAQRTAGTQPVEITVADGVYTPARIEVPAGKPVTLRFIRKDPNPCAEKVIFSELGLSRDLPVDQPQELTLTPEKTGELEFTCQMGMYRGKLVVRE
jgi:plastocyanin domain-containing protein